ncbi:thioredoxin-like protein [Coniochaeta sp. 2T2.1]|nr:thioredoxin-like protein [Coniochaeta sp. 2T2.1]
MALPPKFKAFRLSFTGSSASGSTPEPEPEPLHTIEVYLDYTCPFSAKMFKTLHQSLIPRLRPSPLGHKVQLIFRPQIQPWHPSSTLTHEAALAVSRLAPAKFWDFAAALFADQKSYFDVGVVNETRNATYRRLAKLARESVGVDEEEVYRLLEVPDRPGKDGALNVGNGVTDDLKVLVKMARLVGVHVSPTVLLDGVEAREISSSWDVDQWIEWLGKKVA